MGSLIVGDIILLFFSIYIAIFFRNFHSDYPDMEIGFHVWEVCYNKETWQYGNRLAARLSIILGILFFAIIFPILVFINLKRNYLIGILILLVFIFLLLLFILVKFLTRRKFKLNSK